VYCLEGSTSEHLDLKLIPGDPQPSVLGDEPHRTRSGLTNIMAKAIGALNKRDCDVVINFGHDELPYRLTGGGILNVIPLHTGANIDADAAIRDAIRGGMGHTLGFLSKSQAADYGVSLDEPLSCPIEVPWAPAVKPKDGLLFAGRVTRAKGVLNAVGVSKCVGMPLNIAGMAGDADVVDTAKAAGAQMLGCLRRADLYSTMRKSAALLQLQVADMCKETFGMVTAEALCCGLPVVTWDVGANVEIMDGESGIVVPLGDLRAACEAAREVSAWSRDHREDIRRRAVDRFSLVAVGKKYSQWIAETV